MMPDTICRRPLQSLVILLAIFALHTAFAAPDTPVFNVQTSNELTSRVVTLARGVALGEKAKLSVFVQRMDNGEILVNLDGERPLKPASNHKLFTTAAGLALLGPDYTWKTDVAINGEIVNGVLDGDLIVIGRGDPAIGGRFHPTDSRDLTYIFRDWAARLRESGIRQIRGEIIGDDDYFDDVFFGANWYPDERAEWYCAEVSALSFNDNCIDIQWKGGRSAGNSPSFTLNPPTSYCRINNMVKTVPERVAEASLTYHREERSNIIRAEGTIPARKEKYDYAAIHNPTLFTVTVLRETLQREGIKVIGQARDIDDLTTKALVREGQKVLFTHESPPLIRIVEVINRNSQNLYAELLLRTLGRIESETGGFESGCRMVENYLAQNRLHRYGFCCVDGSGLSYLNRTCARMLVDLLMYMDGSIHRTQFLDSLPRGGERGTLRARFKTNERTRALAPNIYGKTGYIGGVHTLSGYIVLPDSRQVAYAILLNDFAIPNDPARLLVDEIAVEIAGYAPDEHP
jgi:D-alanyl-D-alanine carboxypeptidase/D-alanyl-D-alanine-endopeptidase (penicillin-binding protein 4)